MNTYYATIEQAEEIKGETTKCKCACGESYAILASYDTQIIICDDCYENSSNREKYI
jgi:hypothetical protein